MNSSPPAGEDEGEGVTMTKNKRDKSVVRAKELRRRSTEAEKIIWKHLRSKQMCGIKFRRQQPIGDYIVDFVCFEKHAIIEIDGGQHSLNSLGDRKRDKWLKSQGYRVLRFWNNDIMQNLEGVLEIIRSYV